jgi:hypothetical protein
VDSLLDVMFIFRDALKEIPLPPPTSVDLAQVWKKIKIRILYLFFHGKTDRSCCCMSFHFI